MAWIGLGLGAQRSLGFALAHPDLQPQLLVRLAGGWVPELEERGGVTRPIGNWKASVLLIHGERDEVFPLSDAQRVASRLQSNGVPVEIKIMPGQGHGFEPNRLLVFRTIGEYCLTHLSGVHALSHYRSILSWQARARPLWAYWIPAFVWACGWGYLKCRRHPSPSGERRSPTTKSETALRWIAAILAMAALAQSALHLSPPYLSVSERSVKLAHKHLVQQKEINDFDFLCASPVWRDKRLKVLLTHVELANYSRELVNWKLDDQIYRAFVLSSEIDSEFDGDLNWRRELWENFYPRIRKAETSEIAAEIVVRFLRERVTVVEGESSTVTIKDIWRRQITDQYGFEAIYVAAMRSVGIPSRLNVQGRAELWNESGWQAAPRPLIRTLIGI